MMETLCSSETSVLTRATWHNIPENGLLHSHHCENLKSYREIQIELVKKLRFKPETAGTTPVRIFDGFAWFLNV
jgi:hypothetical protein